MARSNRRLYLLSLLLFATLALVPYLIQRSHGGAHYVCDEGYIILGTADGPVCISGKKAKIVKDQQSEP